MRKEPEWPLRQRANFFQETFLAPERALVDRVHTELDRVLAIDHHGAASTAAEAES